MDTVGRFAKYFAQLVRKATAGLPYAGHYPYSVVSCNKVTQTLTARSLVASMPDQVEVSMVTPGLILDVPAGTEVKIGFAALDPTRPYVASYGSGGTSSVENAVDLGWIGLSQLTTAPFTVSACYVPGTALVPPTPEIPANVTPPYLPTPLVATPQFYRLTAGKVTATMLTPI